MLRDRVSNPGPLTYESGALPIVLRIYRNLLLAMISKLEDAGQCHKMTLVKGHSSFKIVFLSKTVRTSCECLWDHRNENLYT